MDLDATWYGGRPRPRQLSVHGDPVSPRKKCTSIPTQFLAYVYCGQTAGWMTTPPGKEVDLGPGHIELDGVIALSERDTAAPPLFWAHVYCGHGRPSQLLLSSCSLCQRQKFLGLIITVTRLVNENVVLQVRKRLG